MREELIIDKNCIEGNQEQYDSLAEAIKKLSTTSEEQFASIKKEKWFNRVFDMVTFSQKGKKRLAEQIGTVSQAQQVLMELLLRLSAQDASIARLVETSFEDISRLQDQDVYMLNRIKKLENISLGIRPDMDIMELNESEKSILSAAIYFLGENSEDVTDMQKRYANSVIRYIGVDVQMDNPLSRIESISTDSKRKIYACCLEFVFLATESFSSEEVFEDFFAEFDLGTKTINMIKKQISALYKARGVEGIISKYEDSLYETIDDVFYCDFDEEEFSFEEMKKQNHDEYIKDIVRVSKDEETVYKNKNIHIEAYIRCEGILRFENCVIYYNEPDNSDEILLDSGARIEMTNCEVICKGLDKKHFISSKEGCDCFFENVRFVDCAYFLEAKILNDLHFNNCSLFNCFADFVSVSLKENADCTISNCHIYQDELKPFYSPILQDWGKVLFSVASRNDEPSIQFIENEIIEGEKFHSIAGDYHGYDSFLAYFKSRTAIVMKSHFSNLSGPIIAGKLIECSFSDCIDCIKAEHYYGTEIDYVYEIEKCVFSKCTRIVEADENTIINNCQFINCYNTMIGVGISSCSSIEISHCHFKDIVLDEEISDAQALYKGLISSAIFFRRGKNKDSKISIIRKCIFEGVTANACFLIASDGFEKPHDNIVAIVEDCDFKNCTTKRKSGKLIREHFQYLGMFNKEHDVHAIRISDCRGLDNVIVQ